MSKPFAMWAVYSGRSKYPLAVAHKRKTAMDDAWATFGVYEESPGYRVVKVRVEEIDKP